MKFLLVLSVVLAPAQFLLVSHSPTKDTDAAEDEKSPNEGKILTLPVGKCEELPSVSGKSGQEACNDYCKALKEFSGGNCVEEICRCKFDIINYIQSVAETNKDKGKKRIAGNRKMRNGIKCKNLIRFGGKSGPENHGGCGVHCRLLDSENKGGRCVGGVCQCTKEVTEKKPESPEEDEKEKEPCESDETCLVQCREINEEFSAGHCKDGICSCSIAPRRQENHWKIPELTNRAFKKCERRKHSENEEICRSHCESFSRDHTEGRCVDGICHCGYAVFEIMIPEMEENNEKGADKKDSSKTRKVKPRRSRGMY